MSKLKVCRVATVPFALISYGKHMERLQEIGCDITIVTTGDESFKHLELLKVSKVKAIKIARDISIVQDLLTLFTLFLFFKKNNFDLIHSNTPKAGLLTAIAGFFTNSIVIHTFTGQRWQNMDGLKRYILKFFDKLIVKLNTKSYTDSWSQRSFLISEGIGKEDDLHCIHKGGFAGVDLNKFSPLLFDREKIRQSQNIPHDDVIITFVGRITKDKGIDNLIEAFTHLQITYTTMTLLLIGPVEENNNLKENTISSISKNIKIHSIGHISDPERFLSITDIFCLPSYREGFGTVILEASAMKVPSVGTNISGLSDAIVAEKTGILVNKKDSISLAQGLERLITNSKLRAEMGENAYERVSEHFNLDLLAVKNYEEYIKITKSRGSREQHHT